MEENKQTEVVGRKVIKISRSKFRWSLAFLAVILVAFIVVLMMSFSLNGYRGKSSIQSIVPSMGLNEIGSYNDVAMPYPNDNYRYQEQNPSITDTREFLKTYYNADIKTRDVSDVTKQIKNIVKGADGRVDSFSSGDKYGHVRFVVAKSKFDAFRDEIESITHKKLYTEDISSENLLGQKQGIEGQIIDANQSLDSLIAKRTELENNHNKIVTSINKELTSINSQLVSVRSSISLEKEVSILTALRNQETSIVQQQTYQKKKLSDENINYQSQHQNFDAMISNASNNVTNANKTDTKFMDNIETVNGSVDVRWISLWEMAVIFAPIHPTLIIIILIIIAIVLMRRRIPKVEFV